MASARTRISLQQFLLLQDGYFLGLLLEKHGFFVEHVGAAVELASLRGAIDAATEEQMRALLDEIVRTRGDLRTQVAPRYRFDERWDDLQLCLRLDGYVVDEARGLVPIDPAIEAVAGAEDDLTRELRQSGLQDANDIIRNLEQSANLFRGNPPDYNGCLSNARVALQSLGRVIALERQRTHAGNFDETSWGQVLAFLRTSGLIAREEEDGLAGVFGFVSPAVHRPLGQNEQEFARLGRSLVASMCYFLIKRRATNH